MTDYKTKFTQEIMEKLSTKFKSEDLQYLTEAVTLILADYTIEKSCTDLIVRDNKNDRILKQYAACLLVDGKSHRTIEMYIKILRRFLECVCLPCEKVTAYDIRYFLATLKQQGVSDRTLENYRSYISAFYHWLTKEDYIEKNPCIKIAPIKYKEVIRLPFTETEIDALRYACKTPKQRAILEILLSSGIRVNELVNLNIDDIDFVNKTIHIREGKGNKERVVYMSEVCAYHIKQYLETRADNKLELFITVKAKKRILPGGVRDIVRTIGKNAGVENVHPHRFRRTFASSLAKRGMEVRTLAKLMGHSNLQTTLIYVYEDNNRTQHEYQKYTA